MKILDTPRSGKCGQVVAFQSRFGLCLRQWIVPRNVLTPAREFMGRAFGHHSQAYSHTLSEDQLDRWRSAAAQVLRATRASAKTAPSPASNYTPPLTRSAPGWTCPRPSKLPPAQPSPPTL